MNKDTDTLARTIYGESRPSDIDDAEAIASVIFNRVAYRNWPNTVHDVCMQPWQFSCWNKHDPNRNRILNASGTWWLKCQDIAARAMIHSIVDKTQVSTHYHTHAMGKPSWAKGKTPVYSTKAHAFYNDIDTPKPNPVMDLPHEDDEISTNIIENIVNWFKNFFKRRK
jgi:spore germination cell wall hydrolase CwlJ-like protein